MTNIVATQVGSGTVPFVRAILPSGQRGSDNTGLAAGVRTGIQVIVANPEDSLAVDAFAVSGVSIGTVPVEIWSPGINPLPRQRMIYLQNQGPGGVYIGPTSTSVIAPSGYHIHPPSANAGDMQELTLPLLRNVSIWARSNTSASIVILVY